MNDKSKGKVTYTYNGLGELVTQTTTANIKTLYRDVAGRLIKEHNSARNEIITHVYDNYLF